jgi:hypothetical protein
MGISLDEDITSCVHVAHGLEVSSQTDTAKYYSFLNAPADIQPILHFSFSQ